MLHRAGPFDEEQLIEALKSYLPLYGKEEKEECLIPYVDTGVRMVAVFIWLAGQWVYVKSRKR